VGKASGPFCIGECDKRLPRTNVTTCPFCAGYLCLKCTCPNEYCKERIRQIQAARDTDGRARDDEGGRG
jgi:hypothetical protein